jgi:hypothetical protein
MPLPDRNASGPGKVRSNCRLFDHGAITVREDLRVRVARSLAGSSARDLFKELEGQELRLPVTNSSIRTGSTFAGSTPRFFRAKSTRRRDAA